MKCRKFDVMQSNRCMYRYANKHEHEHDPDNMPVTGHARIAQAYMKHLKQEEEETHSPE